MIFRAINSRIASYRSHSTIYRWISAFERRRKSRRGGKSPSSRAGAFSLYPLWPFVPDQKAKTEPDRQSLAMKTIPTAPLVLIPVELTFSFFIKLLDPMTTVRIFGHFLERCLRSLVFAVGCPNILTREAGQSAIL